MVKLEADMLAPLVYRTVPLSEGTLINGVAGSVADNNEADIVPDIVAYTAAESIRLLFVGCVSGIYQGTE